MVFSPTDPSSSTVDASTNNADSPTRGNRTSPLSDRTSPPTPMVAGEQLLPEGEKVLQEPSSPASPDLSPQPQAQPQPEPEPKPDPAAIAAEAEKLKEQGNESFKRGRYGDAVDLYTKAIGPFRPPSILSVYRHCRFSTFTSMRHADSLMNIQT